MRNRNRLLSAALVVALLAIVAQLGIGGPAYATPPGIPTAATAKSELATLTVAAWTNTTTYDRDLFPTWDTISGTCAKSAESR